jgi:hypothetical protein
MKIRIPLQFKDLEIDENDVFIAKNGEEFISVELPTPNIKWWIDGYNINENFNEVILVDGYEEELEDFKN